MKILLTALNAKYIHSNLAIHCLRAYAKEYQEHIELAEFTINNYTDYILQEIYAKKPDIVAFSCYIWNIGMIEEIAIDLHKVLPETKIWLGGPEVSYDAKERLLSTDYIDGIMIGEGEQTFKELVSYYVDGKISLSEINGLAYRASAYKNQKDIKSVDMDQGIEITKPRQPMDLSLVPFPYDNIKEFKNKMIYYETSRGCPYSCSYCLSSIDKQVRIRNMDIVKKELSIFLENKIPQVKFVDRTFNCRRSHTFDLWTFIKEHDNGITNFHFEISADIINEEELELLASMRVGLVQLEIGIQSTNTHTIDAINRKMDFEKISKVVKRINKGKNIHVHLDLIAGLPYENYSSFRNSFNDVYALEPEQFQLGFLKVLKGSEMYFYSKTKKIIYKDKAPYEVLFTDWLTYDEILGLKAVEDMVEVYYNSSQFTYAIKYLEHLFKSPFDLYEKLGKYYINKDLNSVSHSRISRYNILLEFFKDEIGGDSRVFEEILVFDLYLRENLKSRPPFARKLDENKDISRKFYNNNEIINKYLEDYKDYSGKQISRLTYLDKFSIDVLETAKTGIVLVKEIYILFDYQKRNPLTYEADIHVFEEKSLMELIGLCDSQTII